jgi:hypothetical protein
VILNFIDCDLFNDIILEKKYHVFECVHGIVRARPLTLHPHLNLHFYIRDADADAWKCPTQLGITQMWMKKLLGGFMQATCYQLKTSNFGKVFKINGWGLTG